MNPDNYPYDRELLDSPWQTKDDTAKRERLFLQMQKEAYKTNRIQVELERMALSYNLVPHQFELSAYSHQSVKEMADSVMWWVVLGEAVPSFRWEHTRLVESKIEGQLTRTIRPHEYGNIGKPRIGNPKPALDRWTRIRTWAVYYMSRRGGGDLPEEATINCWNTKFRDGADAGNYRKERQRLFERGAQKRVTFMT